MKSNPDGDGVDIPAFFVEHDAEVFVFVCLVKAFEVLGGARFVHVAERHNVLGPGGVVRVHATLAATQPVAATFSLP